MNGTPSIEQAVKPRAKVRDVLYVPFRDITARGVHCVRLPNSGPEAEFASCICLAHPNAGSNGIKLGGPILTTKIVKRYENGDFETLNTYYEVVK